jgi:uncharacterized protein with FMN-binding domain
MRRIVMALLGTAIGTTLLIGLKTQGAVTELGLSAGAPADPANSGDLAAGQPGASLTPEATAGPGAAAADPGASAGPTASGKAPSASAATTTKPLTATATKTTAAAAASRTILGDAAQVTWQGDNYGNMQVKIVVTGTHINDVVTVQKSSRSGSVSTTLRTQALNAQSANVGNVSGATASSNAYKRSLQSAIAKI